MYKNRKKKSILPYLLIICLFSLSLCMLLVYFSAPRLSKSTDSLISSDEIAVPIIMYHGLIKDRNAQNKFYIAPETFENDLKYLKNKGYNTINMTELINYVYNGTPLPENPIILTFDDGNYNNYVYAYPLLREYNQKAVISIIGIHTDIYSLNKDNNAYYSNLTWSQINEMIMSSHIEIQNHTYNLHTNNGARQGCDKKSSESSEEYKILLTDDLERLQQRITDFTGTTPNTIAYPFGHYSKETEVIIKDLGFKASLTCAERINYISRDTDCLYRLGRFLRPQDKSSADFFKSILKE